MKQTITKCQMPRNLKPLLLTPNCLPQLQTRRPTLRYPVAITLQIASQRSNALLGPSSQPVEQSMDLLMEYRWGTRLMTLVSAWYPDRAVAAIPANCSSAVPCILISVFCRVCLPEFGLRTNCTFLNLKKFPLLLLLDIAGHCLVFNRWSLRTGRVITWSFLLYYLSNII